MGAVYLAMDEVRHEQVAIKVPATSRRWQEEYRQRVIKEIGILSALQHPNIIEIHDWGQDPQLGPYIVMEYIEGGSVLQMMKRYPGERLNPLDAMRIAATVADALAYAHARPKPIIHRDIKPDNVLVRISDGLVKVSDFGLAAVLTGKRAQTQWGTPDYIAPEQALGRGADARSDLYALSATLFHMLTGLRPPSLGQPLPGRPSALMTQGILDVYQVRRLDYLIITLLAYDPDQRRPAPNRRAWRASEVAEELRAIIERRQANVYASPEDSAIFPALMTSVIPPAGVPAPRQGQPPFQQPAPRPPMPPQAPPVVPIQRGGPVMPPGQPMPPMPPPQQAPAQRVGPSVPQAPPMMPQPPAQQMVPPPPPPPPPPQRVLQAEQMVPPTSFQAAPVPPPQAFRPSGGLPAPVAQGAPPLPAGAIVSPPLPPQAIQYRPGPAIAPQPAAPPPQPRPIYAQPAMPPSGALPAAPRPAAAASFSSAEKEALTGLLVGALGVAAASLILPNLPLAGRTLWVFLDPLLTALLFWGIGLIVGVASPGGRKGRFPWLAMLICGLTLLIGFPVVQVIRHLLTEGTVFTVLFGLPFLVVGTLLLWVALKLFGKNDS